MDHTAARFYAYGRIDALVKENAYLFNGSERIHVADDFVNRYANSNHDALHISQIWDQYITELQSFVVVILGVGSEDDDVIYNYDDERCPIHGLTTCMHDDMD